MRDGRLNSILHISACASEAHLSQTLANSQPQPTHGPQPTSKDTYGGT